MQEKRVPLRKCIGCGEMIGKKGAVRVVRSKEFPSTPRERNRDAELISAATKSALRR